MTIVTGGTANAEALEFLQDVHAGVLEKSFTAEALLSAVDRVTA